MKVERRLGQSLKAPRMLWVFVCEMTRGRQG